MTALAKRSNARRPTLSTQKRNLLSDHTWRPRRDQYAEAHRIFIPQSELELLNRIATKYVSKGPFHSDGEFEIDFVCRSEGIMPGMALSDRQMEEINKLKTSGPFIQAFRNRNRLSLRSPSFKRRPKPTEAARQKLTAQVHSYLQTDPRKTIINIDETHRKTVAGGLLTWAHTSAESVQSQMDNDEKGRVTVIAAVDAEGAELPLTVIGKGQTKRRLWGPNCRQRCRSVFQNQSGSLRTSCVAIKRHELYREGPLIIMLDAYAAHRSREVWEIAEPSGIQLVFIPPGCTDELQPLDRRVFRGLESHARQLRRQQYPESGGAKTSRPMMAANLCEAWG
jgi:hypothetical protein